MTDVLSTWWPVLALLLTAVIFPGGRWIVRKGLASHEDVAGAIQSVRADVDGRMDAMTAKLTSMTERLGRIEEAQRNAPDHDDINRLHGRVDEALREIGKVTASMSRIEGSLSAIDRNFSLLLEHHIGEKR